MPSNRAGTQRSLERTVPISRFVRIVLGVVVLTAGVFFVTVSSSALLIWAQQISTHPHAMRLAVLSFWGLVLSLGFVAVGFRLVRMRTSDEHLFGPIGLRITGFCGAVLATSTIAEGLRLGDQSMSPVGAFLLVMAIALYRSAQRVNVSSDAA